MIRVVLDTNIIISAILFGGKPRAILRLVIDRKIQASISPYILFEIKEVLYRKFSYSLIDIAKVEDAITETFTLVHPKQRITQIKENKADNHILECATEARAGYLITGDTKHILPLRKIKKIQIVSADEFLRIYKLS